MQAPRTVAQWCSRLMASILAALILLTVSSIGSVRADVTVSIAVSSTPKPNYPSQQVTFSVQLTPNPGGGTVTLQELGTNGGDRETVSVNPATGGATFTPLTTVSGTTGDGIFQVAFSGAPGYSATTSGWYFQPTSFLPLTLTPEVTPEPSIQGDPVNVRIGVTPNPGGGSIAVQDGALPLATLPIDPATGVAEGQVQPADGVGSHPFYFSYVRQSLTDDFWGTANTWHDVAYRYSTVTTVTLTGNPAAPGDVVHVKAKVTPTPTGGSVAFMIDGSSVTVPVSATGVAKTDYTVAPGYPFFTARNVTVTADFSGFGEHGPSSGSAVLKLRYPVSADLVWEPDPVIAGEATQVTLIGRVSSTPYPAASGKLTFELDGVVVGSKTMTNLEARLVIPTPAIGTHSVRVSYPGSSTHMAAAYSSELVVKRDTTVRLSNVAVSQPNLFPVVDGYRDTTKISGKLGEPARVVVKVKRESDGVTVRTWSLGRRDPGSFSVTWDGRNDGGAMVGAGDYRAFVTATDDRNNKKTISRPIAVDLRQLVKKTKTITVNGSERDAQGKTGDSSITVNSDGSVTLNAGGWSGTTPTGWAGLGYEFTVPAATKYVSLKFASLITAPQHAPPIMNMMAQDFSECPYDPNVDWNTTCFSAWAAGSGTQVWITTNLDLATNLSGRKVRGVVTAAGGTVRVYKARVTVVYKVLQ